MLRSGIRSVCFVCLCAGAGVVQAGSAEDAVKQSFEIFTGMPVVETVTKTPYGGLYEVVLKNGQIAYTDAEFSFLIDGRVIDIKTRQDVTQARQDKLSAIDFSTLPLKNAIKQVRGNGERMLVSFEDPNCGYCKKLWQELGGMDNITIYTFLYPVLGPDSNQKAQTIWCAKNKEEAWTNWVMKNIDPPTAKCDSNVIEENIALGRSLRISGTPTMFVADGRRLGGYMNAAQLEEVLASGAVKK